MSIKLNTNDEMILDILLEKFKQTNKYEINGNLDELPEHILLSIEDIMNKLKINSLISYYKLFVGGEWIITLTSEAIGYYYMKGSRIELFNELSKSDKDLLKKLIEIEIKGENISEYLANKLKKDEKDILRGSIKVLKKNGLLSVMWADDTVSYAELTQEGRTFFEREKEYKDKIDSHRNRNIYNIGEIHAQDSNIFLGDVINSNVMLTSTLEKIEKEINERSDSQDEKQALIELLDEAKEIIEDFKETKQISTRKKFFKKLSSHLETCGWFYGEIVGLLGQAMLMKINGQI